MAVVAGCLPDVVFHFHALERLDRDPPGVGNFDLVSGAADGVCHSPFPLSAIVLRAHGAAVCGRVLFEIFFGSAAVCPAHLRHGVGLRPMVHGHLC